MAIKRLMAKALPDYLVNQVTSEVRLATRRMFTARSVRRSLASQKGCRVNIGCGKNPIQGWINLDVVSYPGVYFWDCRSGLPFSDAAVTAIYSEHFFEHLDAETEAPAFLRECLRCLQSQGVMRLVVPDAGRTCERTADHGRCSLRCDHSLAAPTDGATDGWVKSTKPGCSS
jgi:hypothetical protein